MAKSNQIPPSHQLVQEDARCQIATYGNMYIHFLPCFMQYVSEHCFKSLKRLNDLDCVVCMISVKLRMLIQMTVTNKDFELIIKIIKIFTQDRSLNKQERTKSKIWKQPFHQNKNQATIIILMSMPSGNQ